MIFYRYSTHRRICLFLGFLVVIALSGCNRTYYIHPIETSGQEPVIINSDEPVFIHYFLDRTNSMGGFTGRGEESEYVQVLDFIWRTGDYLWGHTGLESNFYEYWVSQIVSVNRSVWQQEAKRQNYYGTWNWNRSSLVPYVLARGPFGSVSDLIEGWNNTNSSRLEYKCLYVVVTDMHEQNRDDDVFSTFFRRAYGHGQSGALFAINSKFRGPAYRADAFGEDVRIGGSNIDGESTFYIFVAGSTNEVEQYSRRLAHEFTVRRIAFEHVVFLQNNLNSAPSWIPETPEMVITDFALVNFIPLNSGLTSFNIYQWEQNSNGDEAIQVDIESLNILRLGRHSTAKYFAGLPVRVDPINFNYNIELSIRHYLNSNNTPADGHPSDFTSRTILETNIPEERRSGGDHPLYIEIEIDNANLAPGLYHVNYRIVQNANEPDWIAQKSVSSIDEQLELVQSQSRIKIIDFNIIYGNIVNAYNRYANNLVYSGNVYFIK